MPATGEGGKGILVIAEAPGKTEDERNEQLIGEAGRLLRRKLARLGINLDKDCRKINAVNCRPPKNRTPETNEINACRSRVWDEIKSFKPKLIILLGGVALESFLGHRWSESLGGIHRWRGFGIPDQDVKCWVLPTFHPSYVKRESKKPVFETIFEQDLQYALSLLERPFPNYGDEKNCVRILNTYEEVVDALEAIKARAEKTQFFLSFDYETTGIKPHAEGHRIVCVSICTDYYTSISFMMPPEGTAAMESFKQILKNSKIKKVGFNIKFEDTWTVVRLGTEVRGWLYDGMTGSHVIDNRPDICGLEFQAYVNFGLLAWDAEVKDYLRSDDKCNNAFNQIDKIPTRDLLLYCGIDSLVEYRLAEIQMVKLGSI